MVIHELEKKKKVVMVGGLLWLFVVVCCLIVHWLTPIAGTPKLKRSHKDSLMTPKIQRHEVVELEHPAVVTRKHWLAS